MTSLLETAMDRVARLTESDQDAIASLILDELDSEERWPRLFDASPELLAEMGREALAEHREEIATGLDGLNDLIGN